jgi:hypothetical protein
VTDQERELIQTVLRWVNCTSIHERSEIEKRLKLLAYNVAYERMRGIQ